MIYLSDIDVELPDCIDSYEKPLKKQSIFLCHIN